MANEVPEGTVNIQVETSFAAGFDIAQRRDFAAGCVLKRTRQIYTVAEILEPSSLRHKIVKNLPRYSIEWLFKWPLGIPYTQLANDIAELMNHEQLRGAAAIIDRTGVGLSVFEKVIELGIYSVIGVSYSTGDIENQTRTHEWTVGKGLLMTRCQAAMADGRYQFNPDQPHAADLQRELHAMQLTSRPGSNVTRYEGVGQHDDIVNALALATWWLNKKHDVVANGLRWSVQPLGF